MAAGNQLTVATVNAQIVADATEQKDNKFYGRWKLQYDYYNTNYSSDASLNAQGITGTDTILFHNVVADLGKLITRFSGGTPAQTNYLFDVEVVAVWRHDSNVLKQELANEVAFQLLEDYYWWQSRYSSWSTNATNAILIATPLSFAQADATAIENVYNDMNTLALEFNNGAVGAATNMLARCVAVLGVQG